MLVYQPAARAARKKLLGILGPRGRSPGATRQLALFVSSSRRSPRRRCNHLLAISRPIPLPFRLSNAKTVWRRQAACSNRRPIDGLGDINPEQWLRDDLRIFLGRARVDDQHAILGLNDPA